MDAKSSADVTRRLKSVEGHVRGVQITGIQRALKKVSGILLDHHLHACVTDAMRGPDASARERVLGELLEVFEATSKA